jgi:hypothetical protein
MNCILTILLSCVAAEPLDGQDTRRDSMLRSMAARPYPSEGAWRVANFCLAAYWVDERTDDADAEIVKLRSAVEARSTGSHATVRATEASELAGAGLTHWHAYLFERVYSLFSSDSKRFPGRMSPDAESALCELLWLWAEPLYDRDIARRDRVWEIWGSENHQLMMWTGLWGASQIFADHPDYRDRRFADGSSPTEALEAFEGWFKRYARERATKGLLVECASPTYAKYSINCWYNVADFSRDAELRLLFGMLLDVYWADWALEQLNGIRGGSRHRNYPGDASRRGGASVQAAWYHFGIGTPKSKHPGVVCAATTFWRPDPVVAKLVDGSVNLGTFTYCSRRPGRLRADAQENAGLTDEPSHIFGKGVYQLAPDGGDLLRYTHRTPDYVMGTSMIPALSVEGWSRISSQNRWEGVIFAGHPTARIFLQPRPPKRGSLYNAQWSVPCQGSLIVQRLKGSNARGQRIWFDPSLAREEREGWVFVKAPRAFAAVRIASGGGEWESEPETPTAEQTPWLCLRDEFSPVIIEVTGHESVDDMAIFQKQILGAKLKVSERQTDYISPISGRRLTMFTDYSQLPQVDGVAVNCSPDVVYDSPFLRAEFGGDLVTIQANGQRVSLDFADIQRDRKKFDTPDAGFERPQSVK